MIGITISDVEELVKRYFSLEKVKFVLETLDEYKNIIEVDKVKGLDGYSSIKLW